MQINIDKKTGILLGIIAALVLAVVFMLAGNSGTSMGHSGHGSGMTNEERSSEYSSDELMFAQMMIPRKVPVFLSMLICIAQDYFKPVEGADRDP